MKVTVACLLGLVVLVLLEASVSGTLWRFRDRTSRKSKTSRDSKSSRDKTRSNNDNGKLQKAINEVEGRVDKVERRGCAVGNLRIVVCDPYHWDAAVCNYKYHSDAGFLNVPIAFGNYHAKFDASPVVTAGLSGVGSGGPKGCDVSAVDTNKDSFNLRLVLAGDFPFYLNLFWIACDARAH